MRTPTLNTDRLVLRPFSMADCDDVQRLAGEKQIAATTMLIPHPYARADAESWISTHSEEFSSGKGANFAIALREGALVGAIGMVIKAEHERAEIGYWIGVPYWGKGYATEAGRVIMKYGFEIRNLARLTAHHLAHNPASGRVLEKIGMKREGLFPRHVKKWGALVDCVMYGALREEWRPPTER